MQEKMGLKIYFPAKLSEAQVQSFFNHNMYVIVTLVSLENSNTHRVCFEKRRMCALLAVWISFCKRDVKVRSVTYKDSASWSYQHANACVLAQSEHIDFLMVAPLPQPQG